MKSIYMVLGDAGEGSNFIEWHKTMSDEKIELLGEDDAYQSGDGVQVNELKMPDIIDLDNWASLNNITWFEDREIFDLD